MTNDPEALAALPFGLRNPADARPLATVAAAVAMLLAPHFVGIPGPLAPLWIAMAIVLCCCCHVVVHNHTHRPMFRNRAANLGFNLVASIARGHCVSDVFLPHNINHHREQGGPGDWISPAIAGKGHPAARLFHFTYRASWNMVSRRMAMGAAGRRMLPEPFRTSIRWEKKLLPVVTVVCLLHDWKTTLLFQGIPWAASLAWLVAINLFQHDGCDPESEYAHSRNFVGAFTNWLFFNNGYHTVHHLHPGMHWMDAPTAHAQLAGHIPPGLNERSILRFFWRSYLAPRRS
ncbi:MAG TPA: fatty acid desaturase [Burkholderiales bacterium]|nr:fatty acid desaturase [Burkholderiales bacterium]